MTTERRTAVITAETTAIGPDGRARRLAPDTYLIADLDGVAERGEMFVHAPVGSAELVQINPRDPAVRVAEGTEPFITTPMEPITDARGHRPGMVAGQCGHAVAGSEWLAGYRTCERCV